MFVCFTGIEAGVLPSKNEVSEWGGDEPLHADPAERLDHHIADHRRHPTTPDTNTPTDPIPPTASGR